MREVDSSEGRVRATDGAHQGEQTWRHCKADGTEIEVAVYARSMTYGGHKAALVAVVTNTVSTN